MGLYLPVRKRKKVLEVFSYIKGKNLWLWDRFSWPFSKTV